NTGMLDADGEEIIEQRAVNPYNSVYEVRNYLVQRTRRSFSFNMDYKLDLNNTVYFKSMYNWRDDRENRFAYSNEILDGEDIGADDFTIDDRGNLLRFPVEAVRETKGGAKQGRNENSRLEDQRMQNYSIGGEHLFGKLKFDWMTSYAKASEVKPNERYMSYATEFGIQRILDAKKPLFTPENLEDTDLSNFEFNELTQEQQDTEEVDINAFLNFELPLQLFGDQGSLQFGLRTRLKSKIRENSFQGYTPIAASYEFMDQVGTHSYTDPDFLAGEKYQAGSFVTPEFLGSLDLNNESQFEMEHVPDEYLRANFDVDEDVYAGYLMTTQNLTERLSMLAGLRVEHTNISATGNSILDQQDRIGAITKESSYTNFMPSVHLKYNFTNYTILRLAWSNTLARPNYIDLVPYLDVVSEDEEVYLGNAELNPTTAMNFDFMDEHYFRNVGIVSGGVFFKRIDDFIYTSVYETPDASYGEGTEGFEIYQPRNGEQANVYGAEFSFQRQLDFLPGFAKNFNLYLNYTYLASDTNGISNEDGELREDMDLPGTSPHMFNVSLAYNQSKFKIRLSSNF